MNKGAHSLSASITSTLALKPSTVYILRVDNTKSGQTWHIRRCFSEFCELREKILSLIDDQMAAYLVSSEIDNNDSNSSNMTSTSRLLSFSRDRHCKHPCESSSDRFAFVFKRFPPRKLFGSRSKRVIEARSLALNRFLQQALEVVEAVNQRQLIAIYFSMMTHIENFLECGPHRQATRFATLNNPVRRKAVVRGASVVQPLVPGRTRSTLTNKGTHSKHHSIRQFSSYSDAKVDREHGDSQRFSNFDFTRQFYREFGQECTEVIGEDSDDDEDMQVLQKTWSAMLERETHERKLYYSGSHLSMLESEHDSPAKTRTARVEIAGISKGIKSQSDLSTSSRKTPDLIAKREVSQLNPVIPLDAAFQDLTM